RASATRPAKSSSRASAASRSSSDITARSAAVGTLRPSPTRDGWSVSVSSRCFTTATPSYPGARGRLGLETTTPHLGDDLVVGRQVLQYGAVQLVEQRRRPTIRPVEHRGDPLEQRERSGPPHAPLQRRQTCRGGDEQLGKPHLRSRWRVPLTKASRHRQ